MILILLNFTTLYWRTARSRYQCWKVLWRIGLKRKF